MIDPVLKAQLIRDEGRRLTAYRDSAGYWTIGIGHLLGTTPRMSSITDAECDALFLMDVGIAVESLTHVFGDLGLIDAPRFRALVNMMFNRGEEHVQNSTTITPAIKRALVNRDWSQVKAAIIASPWAVQIKGRGSRLAMQFETGVDQ